MRLREAYFQPQLALTKPAGCLILPGRQQFLASCISSKHVSCNEVAIRRRGVRSACSWCQDRKGPRNGAVLKFENASRRQTGLLA